MSDDINENENENENNLLNYERLQAIVQDLKNGNLNNEDKTISMRDAISMFESINDSEKSLEEFFSNNEKELNYFMKDFLDEIINRILPQSFIFGEEGDDIALELLYQIYKLFEKFHYNSNYFQLFKKIQKLFNSQNNFYLSNLKSNNINPKKNTTFHEFNSEFCKDFILKELKIEFKVGEYVDILVKFNESRSNFDKNVWLRGIITKIENGYYHLAYNGEESEISFPIGSPNIRPLGEKTKDWNWRTDLKKYDLVDVYDRNQWWPATIYKIAGEFDIKTIKKVKYIIGFRLYSKHFYNPQNPNDEFINYGFFYGERSGATEEEAFLGDGISLDETLYHFSNRIQKFNTYSKMQRESMESEGENKQQKKKELQEANEKLIEEIDETNIFDINNYISYQKDSKKNIIIGNYGKFSYYYALLLKKIEQGDGFSKFIDILKGKISGEELYTIFTILYNSFDYIHPKFYEENKDLFKKTVMGYIEDLQNEEIRNFSDDIITLASNLLSKINNLNDNKNKEIDLTIKEEINLNLIFKNIGTTIFSKRFKGVKDLNKYLNTISNNEKIQLKVVDLIVKKNIIYDLFGPNYHSKLLSESDEILKILIKHNKLNEDQLKLVWECTQKGDLEAKKTILELMKKLIQYYDEDFIGILLNIIISYSNKGFDENEDDFVFKLNFYAKSLDNKTKIAQYFCKGLFNSYNIKLEESQTYQKLSGLMKKDENYLIKVIEIFENNLKNNEHTLICIDLIINILNSFIAKEPNQNPPYKCEKNCLNDFLKEDHLMKIYEDNFTNYINIARSKFDSKTQKEIDAIIIDGYNHAYNIEGRFKLLKFLINNIYQTYDFFPKLKELFLNNPSTPSDKKYYYKFMMDFFSSENNYKNEATKQMMKEELFDVFIKNDQTKMTYKELIIFLNIFLSLNSSKLDYKVKFFDDFRIQVNPDVDPDEINGIDYLWELIFQAENEKVVNKLIDVLYQIVPEEKIVEKILCDNNEKNYTLLKLFLVESEKRYIIDIKTHYSLLKTCIIKFPLEIKGEENDPKICEFFYDNSSINDIKEELSKKYKIPIDYIEANLTFNNQEQKLDYTYDNKTLKELLLDKFGENERKDKIEFNKILTFTKINFKESLLNGNQISNKFRNILAKWFIQFSDDKKVMTKENVIHFMQKINNDSSIKGWDKRIRLITDKYDKGKKGYITMEEYLNYFKDCLLEGDKFDAFWENLKNMGYNEYLRRTEDPIDEVHISKENLFRYFLSNSDEFLTDFIEKYYENPKIDYKLLFFLSTNEKIYNYLLSNFNKDRNGFDGIFQDQKFLLRHLYYLIIIESIIQDIELENLNMNNIFMDIDSSIQKAFCSKKNDPFDSLNIEDKKTFLKDFVKNGNYVKLINYFTDKIDLYHKNKNELLKECCLKSLEIIIIIFEACLGIKKPDNLNADGNIYYFDYSHMEVENKDLKDKIIKYDYSNLFENLIDYLNDYNNERDEMYNKCFYSIINLLSFNEESFKIISIEKENIFNSLIEHYITSGNASIINILIKILKTLSLNSSIVNNKFIPFINKIIYSKFNLLINNDNRKEIFSKEFLDLLVVINDCLIKLNNDDKKYNLLPKVLEVLINDINEQNVKKKISIEIFIKFLEMINNSLKSNPEIREDIITYQKNNMTLSQIIIEKILISDIDNLYKDNNQINNNSDDGIRFVNIEIKNEDNKNSQYKKIKDLCINYIFLSFEYTTDKKTLEELISINKSIKENLEKANQESNEIQSYNNENNQMYYKKVCGHVGLYNLGATCYMNSIIQQLYMMETLRYALMGVDDKEECLRGKRFSYQDDNLLHQLQVMFGYLTLSEKPYYKPDDFCSSFRDFNGNSINPRVQQDSQEFYNNFCEKIEEHLKKTKYKYIINDILTGKTCSSVKCNSCNYISNRFEDFYNLTLEIKNLNNLNESLKKFVIPEKIDDFKCDNCKQKVTIEKRTSLAKLPNVLLIHLKRFFMNYEYDRTEKINSKFEFPFSLNLDDFCVENFQLQNEENETDEIYPRNKDYYKYELKGINIHTGTASGGHYISLIDVKRDGNGNTMYTLEPDESPKWLKFNDSSLSEFDINNIPVECYGGESKNPNISSTQNAYLLIYERIKKEPIKLVIEKPKENDNIPIIEYTKDDEENIAKRYDINNPNFEITEKELYKLVFNDKDKDEYYKYIPYYSVPKVIPEDIYQQIMEENIQLSKLNNPQTESQGLDKEAEKKMVEMLFSKFSSKDSKDKIKLLEAKEQIDLINLVMYYILKKVNKENLSNEEKKEISNKINSVLQNYILPMHQDEETPNEIIIAIKDIFTSKQYFDIFFDYNKNKIFEAETIDLVYDTIIASYKFLKNVEGQNDIEEMINHLTEYIKKISSLPLQPNKENNEMKNNIKYIYKIYYFLLKNYDNLNLKEKCNNDNIISLLLKGIGKETSDIQDIILEIIEMILKITKECYDEKIFNISPDEKDKYETELKHKSDIKKFLEYQNFQLIFEKKDDILVMLTKILTYNDDKFNNSVIYGYLPKLLKFSLENDCFMKYVSFCYDLLDIKDEINIERMKIILGYPRLIIKPISKSNNIENKAEQKWPLFGAELIKYNNYDLKTEIYKYSSFHTNFCILSYLLPCKSELEKKDKKYIINDSNLEELTYQLISKCFTNGGNYNLYKYLYLLPSRSLYYKNAFEELVNIIKNNGAYNISFINKIENFYIQKIKYEINEVNKAKNPSREGIENLDEPILPNDINDLQLLESNKIKNFTGLIPDFIPGEIIREEFEPMIKSTKSDLIKIEYFTKYYSIDELKQYISENQGKELINKNNDENIDLVEDKDHEENTIKIDVSNKEYKLDEDNLILTINKKLKEYKKFIIEDGMIEDKNRGINSLVRYIFINKKFFKNRFRANIKKNKNSNEEVLNNMCIPMLSIDYALGVNYADFLDINRIKKDESFIGKDDISMNIKSKFYMEYDI